MSQLASVCRANKGIIHQKLDLMNRFVMKYGLVKAKHIFQQPCPIVHASLGQHYRHSLDHIERAAASYIRLDEKIHYDWRERGGKDETDWDEAARRIISILVLLDDCESSRVEPTSKVQACFMLSGDTKAESVLESTLVRELGFSVHHAIHHMAMCRIIATCKDVGGLTEEELPKNLGRAPSTVNYDRDVSTTSEEQEETNNTEEALPPSTQLSDASSTSTRETSSSDIVESDLGSSLSTETENLIDLTEFKQPNHSHHPPKDSAMDARISGVEQVVANLQTELGKVHQSLQSLTETLQDIQSAVQSIQGSKPPTL
jgi:uncharacterized coiled-coil protein SlyX